MLSQISMTFIYGPMLAFWDFAPSVIWTKRRTQNRWRYD